MDELIYLETDEEITSAIDKLKQTEANSIGLVLPKGAALIQSIVNLKILNKEAKALGKKIAIVTSDEIGRHLASQVGLVVYDSPRAQKPHLEQPKPEISANEIIEIDLSEKKSSSTPSGVQVHHYEEQNQTPSSYSKTPMDRISLKKYESPQPIPLKKLRSWKSLLCFTIAFILIASVFYIFYLKATITLAVITQPFEKSLQVIIDNNINKTDEKKLAIMGDLQETEKETTKEFTATGKKEVGEKATGTITVYNEWDSAPHTYPAATTFTSNDKIFLANSSFTVPGGTLVSGKIQAGSINIQVTAESPGPDYNLAPTTLSISSAPSKIFGQNSQPLSGGTNREITVVSSDDINNAKNQLVDELSKQTKEELLNKAKGQKVIDSSVENIVVSSSSNKNVDEEIDKFNETVKVKSRTISFYENDYQDIIALALVSFIPPSQELIPSFANQFSINNIETDYDHGILKVSGTIKTKLGPNIDLTALKKNLAGKNESEAINYAMNLANVKDVNIRFRPSWWLRMVPKFSKNIEIKISY